MTSTTAEVSFAAELVTMLVAIAGLVLAVRSRDMDGRSVQARTVLGGGFAALAVVAFLEGSTLVSSSDGTAAVRLGGALLVAAGGLVLRPQWPNGPRRRGFLGAGLVVVAASGVAELAGASTTLWSVLLGLGAVIIAAPVAAAGRRAIATRIAVASAGTLLLVLVVVSVAMSQVISSSVEDNDLARMAERASVAGFAIADQVDGVVEDARIEQADILDTFQTMVPNPLLELGTPSPGSYAQGLVQDHLREVSSLYPRSGGGYAYVTNGSSLVLVGPDGLLGTSEALARTPGLIPTTCASTKGMLIAVRGLAFAVAAAPECSVSHQVIGTVLAITPLDDAFLATQRRAAASVGVALVLDGQVLAASGPSVPGPGTTTGWTNRAVARTTSTSETIDGRFVAVQPIAASGPQSFQVVVASSESGLIDTRDKLFRTLFLVALGSTAVALALAVLVGERITSGLRRLTDVVGRVQASTPTGNLPRAGSLGSDEVGVLGRAFDGMIDEVEERSAELRAAADDETRLRNRLEAVVAGISDSLVAVDLTGRIIEFNDAAVRLFGLRAGDALGAPVDTVVVAAGHDGTRLGERLGRPVTVTWELETEVLAAGGQPVPVTVSAGATRGPAGELIGAVLVVRDLRSERELERMKTEFLSRVGHELRTPLTGIMGYAEILSRRPVEPDRAKVWHEEILGSARRLLRIVEMLEFFASAGAGHVRLRPEALDPTSLVAGVAAKWSTTLAPDHQILRRVEPGTPSVLADRRWLVMALDELLDNAAKFSPSGGRIAIGAGPAGSATVARLIGELGVGVVAPLAPSDDEPWVEVVVADCGEGMTSDQQAIAFGDFVQADTSDTRRFGGLGLGLALVKRVVEGHGGTVVCHSAAGVGSAFVLRLPTAPTGPSLSAGGAGASPYEEPVQP